MFLIIFCKMHMRFSEFMPKMAFEQDEGYPSAMDSILLHYAMIWVYAAEGFNIANMKVACFQEGQLVVESVLEINCESSYSKLW